MSKTISARIDDTLHSMITDEANQEGKTVNESLKEMLNNHFNEEGKKEIFQSQNEASEKAILQLGQNQEKQDNNLKELFKILDRITNRMTENDIKLLEAVDQRFDDHIHRYKHSMNCIDNGLRCNSS